MSKLFQMLLTTNDAFEIKRQKKRMDRLTEAKLAREEFLLKKKAEGGDIHYFKRQSFGPCFKKTV